MNTKENKVGLDALLTPENSVLVLIDHQPFQFANTRNMDPTMILNNTIGLAKAAKAFKVPTILTTVVKDRGGSLPQALQAVFPDQVPIDRTTAPNETRRSPFFGCDSGIGYRKKFRSKTTDDFIEVAKRAKAD